MMELVAERVAAIQPPAVARMLQKAHHLESRGAQLTYLMRGEPDFETPEHIQRAAMNALRSGHTHYSPTKGIPELRKAVAGRMSRDAALDLDPESEILITDGATMGIYIAIMAVVNPGDEVIVFDPVYDPYPTIVSLAGGIPIRLRTQPDKNGRFWIDPAHLRGAITGRTKAILINNPWNPTGRVMTEQELQTLVEIAQENDLVLISDEIYEKVTFDGSVHRCLAALSEKARARTITVNSLSKTYAMTGWRIGYNLAPPVLTKAMLRIGEQFSRSAATFIQHAALEALNGSQEPVVRMMETYAERRAFVTNRLHQVGFTKFAPPQGTFFALLDIRRYERDADTVADYLLEQAHVVTIPASAYGEGGEGFLRLSFAYRQENLDRGLDALAHALDKLS